MPVTEKILLPELASDAVENVFATMLSIELEPLDSPIDPSEQGGERVVGSIGFGGRATGIVYLYLSETFARSITSTMLGLPEEEVGGAEINDVIGELCNMIGGSLKSNLCDQGLSCQLSLPSVLRGKEFQIETPGLKSDCSVEAGFRYQNHLLRSVFFLKEENRGI